MSRIQKLITGLGGTTKVANALGKTPSTVSSWIKRRHIPIAYWPTLIDAGVSKDDLVDAHLSDNVSEDDEPEREVLVAG